MVNDAPILYREDKASEWKKYIVGRVRKNTLYIHVSIPISKASWRKAKRRYCGPRRLTFSALELRLTIVQPTMQPWYTVRPGSLEILEIIPSRRCCAVVIVLVSGGGIKDRPWFMTRAADIDPLSRADFHELICRFDRSKGGKEQSKLDPRSFFFTPSALSRNQEIEFWKGKFAKPRYMFRIFLRDSSS